MNKGLKIVLLAKQVPDTRAVGKDAMKEDGTVNRAALPAIYNPEDLGALEQAIRLKEMCPGSTITVVTMGPPRAADVLRESIFRGADSGVLVTDRKFAGADTLATSYTLAAAVRKIGADVVIAGRQAIDGDTAQVGPQVAEKLDLPQVTYCEDIEACDGRTITIKRRLERGVETVECPLPMVITVNASAPECRPQEAKRVMKYKHSMTVSEVQALAEDFYLPLRSKREYLNIPQWGVVDLDVEEESLGLKGSPTKVKKIENIVFTAKEAKQLGASDGEIEAMIQELIASHTIG
ncbi:MAG: electron transfer flavoprotein subunit beta/FixA family protein [Rikenellaceae bacterium]